MEKLPPKDLNIIRRIDSNGKTRQMQQEQNLGRATTKGFEDFQKCESLRDVYKYIETKYSQDPYFKELGLNLFKYKDFHIKTGKTINMLPEARNLSRINSIDLSCAPQLVFAVVLPNQEDMVQITQVPNSQDSSFVQYLRVKEQVPFSQKRQFMQDFNNLAELQLYNPAMLNSSKNWLVMVPQNIIYIDDWSNLDVFLNQQDKRLAQKTLSQMCGLIY